jgi:histidine triad (HIT) family protein
MFCQIAEGKASARLVHQDDSLVAFHDIHPQAPVHVLIVPRRHITSLLDVAESDEPLLGALVRTARDIAASLGLAERGYRLVFNTGRDAGYSVYHVHLHLLGGRPLGWPPG